MIICGRRHDRNMKDGSDNETLAKKIYLEHSGSAFHMERAGLYETYRQLEIPREREVQWAREESKCLLEEFFCKGLVVDHTFFELADLIESSCDIERLRALLCLVRAELQELDTMTLVLIAEGILRLLGSSKHSDGLDSESLLEEERCLVKALLKRAGTMEFCVASAYRERGNLRDILSEEQIRERVSKGIRKLEASTIPTKSKTEKFWRWLLKCVGRPQKKA